LENEILIQQETVIKGLQGNFSLTLIIIELLIIIILLFFAALLNAAETAIFTIKGDRENISKNNSPVKSLPRGKNQAVIIATLWITKIILYVSAIILALHLTTSLTYFELHPTRNYLLFFLLVTFFIVAFVEIVPRIYGSNYPGKLIKFMSPPLSLLATVFRPWNSLFVKTASLIDEKTKKKNQKSFSADEISQALELASEQEITSEKEILEGIVNFGNKNVAEIMCPRPDVVAVDVKIPYSSVLEVINSSGYSRIPVFTDSFDQIKGILYIKDLLPHIEKSDDFAWEKLLRPPFFVPETRKVKDLLEDFQKNKIHMAVVVDEYGGSSGIVTMEDVLEEIVGDIADEFDEEENYFTRLGEKAFLFDGKTHLDKFLKIVECKAELFDDVKGDADTLAGLLLEIKGDIPALHESILYADFHFTIESVTKRRIQQVKVEIH
jgi:putative hemolysin